MASRTISPICGHLWSALLTAWLAVRLSCAAMLWFVELLLRLADALFRALSLAMRWAADRVNGLAIRMLK